MGPIQFLLGMLADMREGIKGTDKGEGTTPSSSFSEAVWEL